MKTRALSFFEIKERFNSIILELEDKSLEDDYKVQEGNTLLFALGVCVSQMKAPNSENYPDKRKHVKILEEALSAITFKLNTSTIDEIVEQINVAYKSFGVQ